MINDDLISKFNRIEDLPISEEILGAYIEGQTDPLETLEIENALDFDPDLSMLTESIGLLDDEINDFSTNLDKGCDYFFPVNIDSLELPSCDFFENAVWNDNDHYLSDSMSNVQNTLIHEDFLSVDSIHESPCEDDNHYDDISDFNTESDCNILDLD